MNKIGMKVGKCKREGGGGVGVGSLGGRPKDIIGGFIVWGEKGNVRQKDFIRKVLGPN